MITNIQEPSMASIQGYLLLFALFVISLGAVTSEAQNINANNTNANSNRNPAGNINVNPTPNPVSSQPSDPSTVIIDCSKPEDFRRVKVTRAFKSIRTGDEKSPMTKVQLGNDLTVEVEGLEFLIQKSQCTNPRKNILLFLDGKPLKDVTPFSLVDPTKKSLVFPLKRTDSSREAWTSIVGSPSWSPRETIVSVGLEGEYAVESDASISIEVIPHGWFIPGTCLLILLIIGFSAMAVKSDLLRKPGPLPFDLGRKPYSLSRTQMTLWLFLIVIAQQLFYLTTGQLNAYNSSTLWLLAITYLTGIISAYIDARRGKDLITQGKILSTSIDIIKSRISELNSKIAESEKADSPSSCDQKQIRRELEELAVRLSAIESRYVIVRNASNNTISTGFLRDLISDIEGISLPRIQFLIISILLMVMFCSTAYSTLSFPEFSWTTLALLGLSSGAFIAFKFLNWARLGYMETDLIKQMDFITVLLTIDHSHPRSTSASDSAGYKPPVSAPLSGGLPILIMIGTGILYVGIQTNNIIGVIAGLLIVVISVVFYPYSRLTRSQ